MITEVDGRLMAWMADAVPGARVSLGPPADGDAVSCYLLDVVARPPARGAGRTPLQFGARYLISLDPGQAAEGHDLLAELLFHALELTDGEVELGPFEPALWIAFGVRPRPAFCVSLPVRRERLEPARATVREPLTIHLESIGG